MSPDELLEAKAYSLLFALIRYTYTNIVEEGFSEAVSKVEKDKEWPMMMMMMEMTMLDPTMR